MTLLKTIEAIEVAASRQPSVNLIVRNDIFRLNTFQDARYGVFAWTQGQHSIAGGLQVFEFTFFYVDRLTADKSNEVEIQSVGVQTIDNIIRLLDDWDIPLDGGSWTAQTFNQRFLDECAGVFSRVRLEVPVAYECAIDEADYPEWADIRRNDYVNVRGAHFVGDTLILL